MPVPDKMFTKQDLAFLHAIQVAEEPARDPAVETIEHLARGYQRKGEQLSAAREEARGLRERMARLEDAHAQEKANQSGREAAAFCCGVVLTAAVVAVVAFAPKWLVISLAILLVVAMVATSAKPNNDSGPDMPATWRPE